VLNKVTTGRYRVNVTAKYH